MKLAHPRCVGMDISKTDAKVCVRVQGKRGQVQMDVTTWGATSSQILGLIDMLVSQNVSCVAMEATGDYWKPFYYLMESAGLPVMLIDPKRARQIPGRKTDVNDAMWIADVAAHNLVRSVFVLPVEMRQVRDLVRSRTVWTRQRAKEVQRLEKLLESTGMKLSSVISDLAGVSGRRMLEALADGENDPMVLARLGDHRLKASVEKLTEALTGRFSDHHGFLVRLHLKAIDEHDELIRQVSARIEQLFTQTMVDQGNTDTGSVSGLSLGQARLLLDTIPGVGPTAAEQIIAEIGLDMTQFPTPADLASWAGVVPGSNRSAGKTKSSKTRPGDRYLKGVLGVCANSASNKSDTFLAARYKRILARRGIPIARVAIMRSIIEAVWHILSTGQPYHDLGADYYIRRRPGQAVSSALKRLKQLGFTITDTGEGLLVTN